MKPLVTSIYILFAAVIAFSQKDNLNDAQIKDHLVGVWEHIRSIEPTGEEFVYERRLELKSNGSGLCTKYGNKDTVEVSFSWEVKDSTIYLFYTDKKGVQRTGDQQYITWMGERMLELHQKYSADEYGKICAYRRQSKQITTSF